MPDIRFQLLAGKIIAAAENVDAADPFRCRLRETPAFRSALPRDSIDVSIAEPARRSKSYTWRLKLPPKPVKLTQNCE
jgi:hypothetical protein